MSSSKVANKRARTHTPRNTNKSKYNLSISIDQCSYFQTTFTGVWGNCYCDVNGMGCKPMDIVTIYVDDSNNIDFNVLGISKNNGKYVSTA